MKRVRSKSRSIAEHRKAMLAERRKQKRRLFSAKEIEEDRKTVLAQHRKFHRGRKSPGLETMYGPGTAECHTALHAVDMFTRALDGELLKHTAIILNPKWYRRAYRANMELVQLYQDIGAVHLSRLKS